jgi:hypothetical protein
LNNVSTMSARPAEAVRRATEHAAGKAGNPREGLRYPPIRGGALLRWRTGMARRRGHSGATSMLGGPSNWAPGCGGSIGTSLDRTTLEVLEALADGDSREGKNER